MNRIFDTNVQELKYEVLKSIVEAYLNDRKDDMFYDIPKDIVKGQPTTRCCIYKERAIVQERIRIALDSSKDKEKIVEVIDIACDQCAEKKYIVHDCKKCVAKRCQRACPKDAISFVDQKAVIDYDKCIKCGKCEAACQFNAITHNERPCEKGCPVKAISAAETKEASIDYDKCINCGACVYECPFGAIVDRSFITDALDLITNKDNYTFALIAPSIVSQFDYATVGQVVTGLKKLGFKDVVEAALGADIVAYRETYELQEKGFLTSSCCPSFVNYIKKHAKEYEDYISHNLSPMKEAGRLLKEIHPGSKVIFIGPCISKKVEVLSDDIIDCAITFEELQALLDGFKVDIQSLEETPLNNASYFGRIFARSGGISDAVLSVNDEENLNLQFENIICNGINEIKLALLKNKRNIGKTSIFIEGMVCENGCIGGAGCCHHYKKDKVTVENYSSLAKEKTIRSSIEVFDSILNLLK